MGTTAEVTWQGLVEESGVAQWGQCESCSFCHLWWHSDRAALMQKNMLINVWETDHLAHINKTVSSTARYLKCKKVLLKKKKGEKMFF